MGHQSNYTEEGMVNIAAETRKAKAHVTYTELLNQKIKLQFLVILDYEIKLKISRE